ncbi:MAG: response regulator [Planctomycetota bacterium]|nr:response regulator [Planctomycetota bacterium]MDA1165695.1 response regulator [Planctomycetota bacterium]
MTRIQVAEDSPTQAVEIEFLLQEAGYDVAMAGNGQQALETIRESRPDIVLTDLHMPEMNGLQLIEAVRKEFAGIPVIMMTADGTEEIAARALNAGASSYIPKRMLERDLLPTLSDMVGMLRSRKNRDRLTSTVVSSDITYQLPNDHELANALIGRLEEQLSELNVADATGVFRIALGIKEALMNAIDHGNLELNSKLREGGSGEGYRELGSERMKKEPYASRRVTVRASFTDDEIRYVIADQGSGFDPSTLPNPLDPENLLRPHGRGLMLIQNFMDSVSHNRNGTEITMVKRRHSTRQVDDHKHS